MRGGGFVAGKKKKGQGRNRGRIKFFRGSRTGGGQKKKKKKKRTMSPISFLFSKNCGKKSYFLLLFFLPKPKTKKNGWSNQTLRARFRAKNWGWWRDPAGSPKT